MKKIYYRKLVRDKIPRRIEESGGKCLCRKLSKNNFKKELLRKVEEEAGGIANAVEREEIISEIGDVLDVIDKIKKEFSITSQEIKDSRKKELKRKGGFNKKFFLEWAEDTGYKSNERKGK